MPYACRSWSLFIIYYVYALRKYGRWLADNFADLEHKELWQSLLLLACILLVYVVYTTNEGALAVEYLAQVLTLVIIGFVVWRVETLQTLVVEEAEKTEDEEDVLIGSLLAQYCEAPQLYLQHDLTLAQLAKAIDTNRTYLSRYLSQVQQQTFYDYINRLRLNKKSIPLMKDHPEYTLEFVASESGFKSISTFRRAFIKLTGLNPSNYFQK